MFNVRIYLTTCPRFLDITQYSTVIESTFKNHIPNCIKSSNIDYSKYPADRCFGSPDTC